MSFTIKKTFKVLTADKRMVEDLLYMTIAPTKRYEGCLSKEVYKKDEMRGMFFVMSSWQSREAYEKYKSSEWYKTVHEILDKYTEGVLEEELLNIQDISKKEYFESVNPIVKELLTEDVVEMIKSDVSLVDQLEEEKEEVLRLQAKLQNQKRIFEKEKEVLRSSVVEDFIRRMLVVLDAVEMGMKYSSLDLENTNLALLKKEYASVTEGMELTVSKLEDLFAQNGVKKVEADGDFNPEVHQAISAVEDDNIPENQIVSVLQNGYYYKDRLVRPAMVVVSKSSKEKSYG